MTRFLSADRALCGAPLSDARLQEQTVFRRGRPNGVESSIRVAIRFRPLLYDESDSLMFVVRPDGRIVDSADGTYSFELDRVFEVEATQLQVYEEVGRPILTDVLDGYNGTVLAYGQTGSGKTHCMFGPNLEDFEGHGVIPRAARQLFDAIRAGPNDVEFVLRCSLLEVYSEQMRDLLDPSNQGLRVKELPHRGVYVDGLTQEFAVCEDDVLDILHMGQRMRAVASTRLNQHSSRSHVLFVLTCEQKLPDGTEKVGKLSLVDLAGSENVGKSGALYMGGQVLEEAKKINCSLSALGNTIQALAEKRPHVPYRDSLLTRVLQETLGGNCKTTLLVTCAPSEEHSSQTLSSLRFATRARSVCNHVKVNLIHSAEQLTLLVGRLRRELAATRREVVHLGGGAPIGADEIEEENEDQEAAEYMVSESEKAGDVAEISPMLMDSETCEAKSQALAACAELMELERALSSQEECLADTRRELLADVDAAVVKAMTDSTAPTNLSSRLRVLAAAEDCWGLALDSQIGSASWRAAASWHSALVADASLSAEDVALERQEEDLAAAWGRLRAQQLHVRRQEAYGLRCEAARCVDKVTLGDSSSMEATNCSEGLSAETLEKAMIASSLNVSGSAVLDASGSVASAPVGWSPRTRPRPQRGYLASSGGHSGSKVVRRITRRDVERLSNASSMSPLPLDQVSLGAISPLDISVASASGAVSPSFRRPTNGDGIMGRSPVFLSPPSAHALASVLATPRSGRQRRRARTRSWSPRPAPKPHLALSFKDDVVNSGAEVLDPASEQSGSGLPIAWPDNIASEDMGPDEQKLAMEIERLHAEQDFERQAFQEEYACQQAEFQRWVSATLDQLSSLQQTECSSNSTSARLRCELSQADVALEEAHAEGDCLDRKSLRLGHLIERQQRQLASCSDPTEEPCTKEFELVLTRVTESMGRLTKVVRCMDHTDEDKENKQVIANRFSWSTLSRGCSPNRLSSPGGHEAPSLL